ncbi:uncharacterized protein BJ171DRAFT_216101 [Polychytrium aggregatum]|uniref:uncharacterized protein n=1 Tax=Polychytrium aggregatum TaxID=110093 RepID=UPI0022FE65A3|nr:uncharacterized protein BJ171DRAFT_216101 [Polychytrium aggregatum]KAI9199316.1 hypothetical protein BJ171DRAFT_216101 [Polychytrium aggregatum]
MGPGEARRPAVGRCRKNCKTMYMCVAPAVQPHWLSTKPARLLAQRAGLSLGKAQFTRSRALATMGPAGEGAGEGERRGVGWSLPRLAADDMAVSPTPLPGPLAGPGGTPNEKDCHGFVAAALSQARPGPGRAAAIPHLDRHSTRSVDRCGVVRCGAAQQSALGACACAGGSCLVHCRFCISTVCLARPSYAEAFFQTSIDRRILSSHWRCRLSARVAALAVPSDQSRSHSAVGFCLWAAGHIPTPLLDQFAATRCPGLCRVLMQSWSRQVRPTRLSSARPSSDRGRVGSACGCDEPTNMGYGILSLLTRPASQSVSQSVSQSASRSACPRSVSRS